MSTQEETRYCNYCDHVIKGRSDKKFCNDFCRNSFHFEHNQNASKSINDINRILRRNRKILQSFLSSNEKKIVVQKDSLLFRGFNFMYFTHVLLVNGITYHFCYEFGYRKLQKGAIEIIKQEFLITAKA